MLTNCFFYSLLYVYGVIFIDCNLQFVFCFFQIFLVYYVYDVDFYNRPNNNNNNSVLLHDTLPVDLPDL